MAEGKVESVKRSRVVKRRSKQIEIVDWALWRMCDEFVRLIDEDDGENGLRLLDFLLLLLVS